MGKKKEQSKTDIKIFVSQRININSYKIPNQIYINVLCGAYRPHKKNNCIGDNTGDNISELQPYFSEITVQYWAWKNYEADYYGLCHYRRFLSFSKEKVKTNEINQVYEKCLNKKTAEKYNLTNENLIKTVVEQFDCILPEPSLVGNWFVPAGKKPAENLRDLWIKMENIYAKDIFLLELIIKEKFPEYKEACIGFLNGKFHRGFNCFIMRKDLFVQMCEFQIAVLKIFMMKVDAKQYSDENKKRVYGYIAELLFGIYAYKIEHEKKYKTCSLQLVFFADTRRNSFHKMLYNLSLFLLPIGTKRRKLVKKIIYAFK